MKLWFLNVFVIQQVVCASFWGGKPKAVVENINPSDPSDYGVDVSYPIHHYQSGNTIFKSRYEQSMAGCYKQSSQRQCDGNELARLEMNRNQPKTQHNYTEIGFKKMKVPQHVWEPLIAFYNANKHLEKLENWPPGNTYTNNWDSPTYMISLEDRQLRGGLDLKQKIWDGMKPILEEWTGKKLKPSSLYGIRVYKDKAVLATHVDRLPLVSSCIIQVDQQLNEPWPVEVYSHAGKAYNVTMVPGELTLYESHTVLHGRPFPMNGTRYANLFVHYIPLDHDEVNRADPALHKPVMGGLFSGGGAAKDVNRGVSSSVIGGHEHDNHEPHVLEKHMAAVDEKMKRAGAAAAAVAGDNNNNNQRRRRGGGEEEEMKALEKEEEKIMKDLLESEEEAVEDLPEEEEQQFEDRPPEGEEEEEGEGDGAEGPEDVLRTPLHVAAGLGDVDEVQRILENEDGLNLLNAKDSNGWQAIHEAARSGSIEIVEHLVRNGADVSSKTLNGGTPLWWARRLDSSREVIEFLESIGAPEDGEDL